MRWHHLSGHAHSAANVVLCDLPVHCDATWRIRQGATAHARSDLQDGLADRPYIRGSSLDTADPDEMLRGHVELDEAYVGGHRPGKRGRGAAGKTIVMGLRRTRDGRMQAEVIPDVRKDTLRAVVTRSVEPGSIVSTDELVSYGLLEGDGLARSMVWSSTARTSSLITIIGTMPRITQTALKISGACLRTQSVAPIFTCRRNMFLDRYLNEFVFRSNFRHVGNAMFDLLIAHL